MVVHPEVACEQHDDRVAIISARLAGLIGGPSLGRVERYPCALGPSAWPRTAFWDPGRRISIDGGERLGDPADSPEHPTEDDAVERHHRVPVGQAE